MSSRWVSGECASPDFFLSTYSLILGLFTLSSLGCKSPSFRITGYYMYAPIGHYLFALSQWNVALSLRLILLMCMSRQSISYILKLKYMYINQISLVGYIWYVRYFRHGWYIIIYLGCVLVSHKPIMLKPMNRLLVFILFVSVEWQCSVSVHIRWDHGAKIILWVLVGYLFTNLPWILNSEKLAASHLSLWSQPHWQFVFDASDFVISSHSWGVTRFSGNLKVSPCKVRGS